MTTKDTQWLHSLAVFNRKMRVWSVADNFGGGGIFEIIIFSMFSSDWREQGGEAMGCFVF